jgi:hypothetical protein
MLAMLIDRDVSRQDATKALHSRREMPVVTRVRETAQVPSDKLRYADVVPETVPPRTLDHIRVDTQRQFP